MLRDKNTLGFIPFNLLCTVFVMVFTFLYLQVFALPHLFESAKATLFIVEFPICLAGIIFFDRRRNIVTAMEVGMMPSLVLFVLGYWHVAGVRIAVALMAGVALSAAYAYLQITKGHSKSNDKRRLILLGSAGLIVFSMAFSLLFPVGEYNVLQQIEYNTNEEYEFTSWKEENCLDSNMEVVCQLDDSIWPTLNDTVRKEVLNTLMVVETNYLGIGPVIIEYAALDETTLGDANYKDNTIRINKAVVSKNTSETAVDTLLHEVYHIYSERCVRAYEKMDKKDRGLLLWRETEAISQDLRHYNSGEEDYSAYACQEIERAARQYAWEGRAEIYSRIDQYLEKDITE